jgi:hypothetical protein
MLNTEYKSWIEKMVSFLMPTKRNWNNYGKRVVDSIFQVNNPYKEKFEILVSSKENPNDKRITWYHEYEKPGDQQYNFLAKKSSGDYIAVIVDYGILPKNYLCLIDFLKIQLKDKNFKITSPATNNKNIYPYSESQPSYPELVGKKPLPKFRIICYPFMDRKTFENKLGNIIFHPNLSHSGDWFLSFFLSQNQQLPTHVAGIYFENIPRNLKKTYDPLINDWRYERNFSTWYFNLYQLIRNYKSNDPYVCQIPML